MDKTSRHRKPRARVDSRALTAAETALLRLLASWDTPASGMFWVVRPSLDRAALDALVARGLAVLRRIGRDGVTVRITEAGHAALGGEYLFGASVGLGRSRAEGCCTFCNRMIRAGAHLDHPVVVIRPAPECQGITVRACEGCARDIARDLPVLLRTLRADR